MRRLFLALISLLAGLPAQGQMQLQVTRPKAPFLLYAPIELEVTINNVSAQSLVLSDVNGKSWLRFLVQRPNGIPVGAGADFLQPSLSLGAGQTVRFKFDITPHYAVRAPGTYRATALVRLPGANSDISAPAVEFSVVGGRTVWTKRAGELVTGRGRVFTLISHLSDNRAKLYAQIDSPEDNLVYTCLPLGDFMELEKPECGIEAGSIWHILYRSGTTSFAYIVLDANGRIVKEETFGKVETRPRLVLEGQHYKVVGGMTAEALKGETLRGTQPPEVIRPGG
jgi:hypothetical protein